MAGRSIAAVGSGFIISADGFAMTNAHVIEGADEVFVTLTDKRETEGRVIGADRRSDVALVKIEASGLLAVRIGDVNKLRVGERVIAIGSPFGLENTRDRRHRQRQGARHRRISAADPDRCGDQPGNSRRAP